MAIHPTALVDPAAELAPTVEVGPFCIVEAGARLAVGVVLAPSVRICGGVELGEGVRVESFAVVGGLPQDLRFDPATPSGVRIGAGTVIREHVTIHRSTKAGGATVVGPQCFLMASSHLAHDCVLGERVILANAVLLAGHVHVGDFAFLGGGAVFHQFIRVGQSAVVSGGSRMAYDVPPYVIAAERNGVFGLNLIGLKRRGLSSAAIADLRACYRAVYLHPGSPKKLAAAALAEGLPTTPEGRHFLEFFAGGTRKLFATSRTQGGGTGAE